MLHKTILAVALTTTLAVGASAQHVITADQLQDLHYMDANPKYKKVQDAFLIDRVEYTATNTIVHFRFECNPSQYTGATFYAPGEYGSWVLKAGNDAVFPLREIRNVQVNGKQKLDKLRQTESYWTEWTSDRTTYTCELYFDRLPQTVKVADLIEGIGYEKATDRFNCLNIKLQTWEVIEPVVAAVEETNNDPIAEEVIDAKAKQTGNEANTVDQLAAITWKAYPNPAETIVNIELSVSEPATIEVFTLQGQQLQQLQTQDRITTLNVADYPSGTYMVRVTVGEQVTTQQIVKK